MKVELDVNQYMEMLKAFTEYSACKAECYRLQEENKELKLSLSNKRVIENIEDDPVYKHLVVDLEFSLN